MSTDYENYSIVYYCKDQTNGQSIQFFWVYSKYRELDAESQEIVDQYIDKYFQRDQILAVEQSEEM